MTMRLRYRILKCRAFIPIFSSWLSVWSALRASSAAAVSSDLSLRFASSISSRSRLISRERSVISVNSVAPISSLLKNIIRLATLRQTCRESRALHRLAGNVSDRQQVTMNSAQSFSPSIDTSPR